MTFNHFMDYLAMTVLVVWLTVGVRALWTGHIFKIEGGTFDINGSAVTMNYEGPMIVNNNGDIGRPASK